MAIILAIDTSAVPVSCAIRQDERLIACHFIHTATHHSQTLLPMIEHTIKMAGIRLSDVDAYAVNAGPGSFTGVRIGIATVKGLAFTDGKPCIAVSTLASMAATLRGLPMDAIICGVMDARCNQVYTACFEQKTDGTQTRLTEDEAISIDRLKSRLQQYTKPILLVGDGAELCYRALHEDLSAVFLAPPSLRVQSAAGVAACGIERLAQEDTITASELQAQYLRLPQAERELRARQQKSQD